MNLSWMIVRHRRRIALAWLVPAVFLLPSVTSVKERLDAGSRIAGSESARVDDALKDRFDSPFGQLAVLVATGLPPVGSPSGAEWLRPVVDRVETLPWVRATHSYLNSADPAFLGADGSGTWLLLEVVPADGVALGEMVALVRELRSADPEALSGFGDTRVRVGGLPAFHADYEDIIAGRFGSVLLVVVGGTFLGTFALGGFLPAQLIGFAPAVAVLVDATGVRLAFGPALLTLAGRWNWWPGDTWPGGRPTPAAENRLRG